MGCKCNTGPMWETECCLIYKSTYDRMLDTGTDQEILKIKKYLAQLFLQLQLLMEFKSTSGWRGGSEAKCQAMRGKSLCDRCD